MLIWVLAVDELPQPPEHLLKYLLRLIQKGPQIKLVLYLSSNSPALLCCGQPTLDTLRDLRVILNSAFSFTLNFESLNARHLSNIYHWVNICSRGKQFDLHFSTVSKMTCSLIPTYMEEIAPLVGNIYEDFGCQYLFGAPKAFECPLLLNGIKIEVQGFSTLRETPIPTQTPVVKEKRPPQPTMVGPHATFYDYGGTPVRRDFNVGEKIRTPVANETKIEICGFVDFVAPSLRFPGCTLIRAGGSDHSAAKFHALVSALENKYSVIVRFDKQGIYPQMCVLSAIDPQSNYLLMEPLPFAEDAPAAPLQFPELSTQPRHDLYDSLIDDLPDFSDEIEATNVPPLSRDIQVKAETPEPKASSGSAGSAAGHPLLIPNPLSDRTFTEVLKLIDKKPGAPMTQIRCSLIVICNNFPESQMSSAYGSLIKQLSVYPCQNVELLSFRLSGHKGPMQYLRAHHVIGDYTAEYDINGTSLSLFPDLSCAIVNRLQSYPDVDIEMRILTAMPTAAIPLCKVLKAQTDKKVTFLVHDVTHCDHSQYLWKTTVV